MKLLKCVEHNSDEEQLGELGLFSLGKKAQEKAYHSLPHMLDVLIYSTEV